MTGSERPLPHTVPTGATSQHCPWFRVTATSQPLPRGGCGSLSQGQPRGGRISVVLRHTLCLGRERPEGRRECEGSTDTRLGGRGGCWPGRGTATRRVCSRALAQRRPEYYESDSEGCLQAQAASEPSGSAAQGIRLFPPPSRPQLRNQPQARTPLTSDTDVGALLRAEAFAPRATPETRKNRTGDCATAHRRWMND